MYSKVTLAANTFNQVSFDLGSKKDLYIHSIHVDFSNLTPSHFAADEKFIFQITRTDETAIVNLSNNCVFKWAQGPITAVGNIPLTYYNQFKSPIKLAAAEFVRVGFYSGGAGDVTVKLLVSERDVKH